YTTTPNSPTPIPTIPTCTTATGIDSAHPVYSRTLVTNAGRAAYDIPLEPSDPGKDNSGAPDRIQYSWSYR
ncbi:MAG: hypothetical protein AAB368_02225, partial [bacterium]